MSHESGAAAASAVHAAIDMRRFPWIRPLVAAYASNFESVAPLFAGNPASPDAWASAVERVTKAPRDRATLERVVSAQLASRQAPAEARASARRLADAAAVAVITGQQTGLFGGPLYVLLKAATAVQIARRIERDHRVPAVPVFWADSEDHDWEEVRRVTVLDANMAPATVEAGDVPGAGRQPIASLVLGDDLPAVLGALEQALAPTEFTGGILGLMRDLYRPGARVAGAFAGLMDQLFGRHGLVVCEGGDPGLKPLVAGLFSAELEFPGRTASLARQAGERMSSLGHAPQVEAGDEMVALLYLDADGRRAIKRRGSDFVIGDRVWAGPALRAEASAHPERFSPNVLLRPLVQDRLFPTACFVAGPAELAYQAQLGEVYRAFGVDAPLLYSRASATLADAAAIRFLERSDLPFEALQPQDDSALNRLLQNQLPVDIDRAIANITQAVDAGLRDLRTAVQGVDPTLAGVVDTTGTRMHDTLATVQNKVIQAVKRKDDTLRRQFARTRSLLFPKGQPQERILAVPYFLNRYGLGLTDRLLETLPLDTGRHYVLQL